MTVGSVGTIWLYPVVLWFVLLTVSALCQTLVLIDPDLLIVLGIWILLYKAASQFESFHLWSSDWAASAQFLSMPTPTCFCQLRLSTQQLSTKAFKAPVEILRFERPLRLQCDSRLLCCEPRRRLSPSLTCCAFGHREVVFRDRWRVCPSAWSKR